MHFYPTNSPKNQNFLKNEKKKKIKHLEISLFHTSAPKIMTCYTVPEIGHMKNVIIFYFGVFFALLPHQQPKNSELKKKEKKTQKNPRDIILHKCTRNHDHMLYRS